MPRPTTKSDLLAAADTEFTRLFDVLAAIPEHVREDVAFQAPIDDQSRSPRDVLAHLHAWHRMTLDWYRVGMAGDKPQIPAPGYTWRDTPALNAAIWERYRATAYAEAEPLVRASHHEVVDIIAAHSDDELFTKKRYAWTGTTSLGAYLVSASSSHYLWGQKTLKAIAKTLRENAR